MELIDDFIGRQAFVDKIMNIIKISNPNRNWSFAIDGDWGSGKTFVLSMLKKELEKETDYVTISYDAWKNDYYKDPLIAILYNLIDNSKVAKWSHAIINGIKKGISIFSEMLNFVPGIKDAKENFKTIRCRLTKKEKNTSSEVIDNIDSYNKALEDVKKVLQKTKKKIVFMVDELDRCEPDYALTILNRLHNLFDFPNCIVIVALNKTILAKVLTQKYGNSNMQYFEKFFDLNFSLPTSGNIDIREKHINKFLLSFVPENQMSSCYLFRVIVMSYLSKRARDVVRFFEKLNFLTSNYQNITMKYQYSCLISYLLLKKKAKNNFFNEFFEESRSVIWKNRIDYDNDQIIFENFFDRELLDYMRTNRNPTSYRQSKDSSCTMFLAILNIAKFKNAEKSEKKAIANYFSLQLDEEVYNDINNIYEIIEMIENN